MTQGIQSRQLFRWGILLLIIVMLLVLYFVNPTSSAFIPKCPFKLLTGWQCAACGFQRAVHASLHGHFAEALHYNLFYIYTIPYLLLIIFTEYVARGTTRERCRQCFEGKFAIYLYIALYCIWTVVRNIWGM